MDIDFLCHKIAWCNYLCNYYNNLFYMPCAVLINFAQFQCREKNNNME